MCKISTSAILLVALLGCPLSAPGKEEEKYRAAAPEHRLFEGNELGLMTIERDRLANEIAAYVSNRFADGSKEHKDLALASRMLAVALQLNPRNRIAVVGNFKLSRGMATPAVKSEYASDLLADFLYVRSKVLQEQGGVANALLAGYLLAFAVEIDADNEDAIYDLEIMRLDGRTVDWDLLYPAFEGGGE